MSDFFSNSSYYDWLNEINSWCTETVIYQLNNLGYKENEFGDYNSIITFLASQLQYKYYSIADFWRYNS